MSFRPKLVTVHDENHFIPRDFLRDCCGGFNAAPKEIRGSTMAYVANFRGHRVTLIDTSKYGGIFTDWMIETGHGRAARIEIKTEKAYRAADHGFTAGEQWIQSNGGIEFYTVCNDNDFYDLLCDLVEME